MMRRVGQRFGCFGDEGGSVLVACLMLIFVMTVLGLSLFDLAQVEARLALSSVADARAYEVAQAGMQRGLRVILEGIYTETSAASLADGTPGCTGGCVTTEFRTLSGVTNTTLTSGGT